MKLTHMERLAAGKLAAEMKREHSDRLVGLTINGKPVANLDQEIDYYDQNRIYHPVDADKQILEFAERTAKSDDKEKPVEEKGVMGWLKSTGRSAVNAVREAVEPISQYADLDESVRASYVGRVELSGGEHLDVSGQVLDYQLTIENLRESILGKNPALFVASSPLTVALAQPVSPGLVAIHSAGASIYEAIDGNFAAARAKLNMAGENLLATATSLIPIPGVGSATGGLATISDAQKFRRLVLEEMIAIPNK